MPAESAEEIRLDGVVQGVGMRPTVYRIAVEHGLRGSVCNDGSAVRILVAGPQQRIDDFVQALRGAAPAAARIDRIERCPCPAPAGAGFHIGVSRAGTPQLALAADAAVCAACLAETRDPNNRRWGHPFANCCACGPRLSIVRGLPYDRPRTSMAAFAMCADCRREYDDPGDRRFHAQPIACPRCGPRLRCTPQADDPLAQTIAWLRGGRIVAVKGIGGYHLACDASNEPAVARLRQRKQRLAKPFALLARDVDMIRHYTQVTPAERTLLEDRAAPIVLLSCGGGAQALAPSIAPRQRTLGFMLPASAMHHQLLAGLDAPIVLTSGNRVDEPPCTGDDEAFERLGGIADGFLWHDRAIVNRVDDAVLRIAAGAPRLIRPGRGLVPAALPLPAGFDGAPEVLALGGELKNTICLLRGGQAVMSQHLGDLGHPLADAAFDRANALYAELFELRPALIAIDRHPDYRAARWGRERAAAQGLALVEVQHHHAHIAACLAEHGVPLDAPPVLGVALDGLGYGDDGSWWGGEFLCADYRAARRIAAFERVVMPGGMQAVREPWRMAWAYLSQHADFETLERAHGHLPFFRRLHERPWRQLAAMRASGTNCPPTTSCGRLFDAVSALAGVCDEANYEGQAAIELEACVDASALHGGERYAFGLGHDALGTASLWPAVLRDLDGGVAPGTIAARFHLGLAHAIAAMAGQLTLRHGDPWQHRIALGGGVFQNAVLLDAVHRELAQAGFHVWSPARVPANDGGLSLGQAVVAAARYLSATEKLARCVSASRPG